MNTKHLHTHRLSFLFCLVLLCVACSRPNGEQHIDDIIAQLTLEEKARLVVGTCRWEPNPPMPAPDAYHRPAPTAEAAASGNTYIMQERVLGAAGQSYAVERLGIPAIVYADGPAGVRINPVRPNDTCRYFATAFPVGIALASSWNTQLVEQVGKSIGNEARAYGVDVMLSPGMNIQRNPLCGRTFEYYSEDPLLTGYMAAAYVKGVQSNGVGTSVKHFAANNQETFRNGINTEVSDRALREIYLRPFEIAVREAQPWTIMSSYNKLHGTYASESEPLLTGILRNEWDFRGFVMTDWWGEHDPVRQMQAGNDLLMPGTEEQIRQICHAVNTGLLDLSVLDRNVRNILRITLRTSSAQGVPVSNLPDRQHNATISAEAATEGMILLENRNHTLPLARGCRVALFGTGSYRTIAGGTGSGYVYSLHTVSIREGLEQALCTLSQPVTHFYEQYLHSQKTLLDSGNSWWQPTLTEPLPDRQLLKQEAQSSDAAVITFTRISGEGTDRTLSAGDYYLSAEEQCLLNEITRTYHALGKPVVVILNIGGVLHMASWHNLPDAILLAWQGGQEMGTAVADLLLGNACPSGRLPLTFPQEYADLPSATNFPLSCGNPSLVCYDEGIYIGYRHFLTHEVAPLYSFGYGLSYTQFLCSDLHTNLPAGNLLTDSLTVSVTVTNTGNFAGKEVVQLYVAAPPSRLNKPLRELKGFAKTRLLQPGESDTLTFTLTLRDLASFNQDLPAWQTDAGAYTLQIARAADDIVLQTVVTLPQPHTFPVSVRINKPYRHITL